MYMSKKDEDSSKKKKPSSRARKTPPVPSNDESELKQQIQEALAANLSDFVKKKNLSQKQVTVLNSFIEEHLSCFILLGYTVDGNTLTVVNASSQKDSDSLGTLLQKFIVRHIEPPIGPPGI